ncbi:MAG: hypothetical protein AAF404_17115 [Pseudomonadota bacterium]
MRLLQTTFSIMTAVLITTACDGGSTHIQSTRDDDTAVTGDDSHQLGSFAYTTVADAVWPPQPSGVSNIKAYRTHQPPAPDREVKLDNTRLPLPLNDEALALIGSRFEVIGSYGQIGKGAKLSPRAREIEIYSYTYDRLITVVSDANGNTSTRWQNASDYQPAETPNEVNRAIALASEHLLQSGHDTNQLIGTALLAHPTTAQYESSGQLFYRQRIMYVTFGRGEGTTPLFRADVNLSNGTVSNAGPL